MDTINSQRLELKNADIEGMWDEKHKKHKKHKKYMAHTTY